MPKAKKCDICGKYYDWIYRNIMLVDNTLTNDDLHENYRINFCLECNDLVKSFIESLKEGTLSVALLDYLISKDTGISCAEYLLRYIF